MRLPVVRLLTVAGGGYCWLVTPIFRQIPLTSATTALAFFSGSQGGGGGPGRHHHRHHYRRRREFCSRMEDHDHGRGGGGVNSYEAEKSSCPEEESFLRWAQTHAVPISSLDPRDDDDDDDEFSRALGKTISSDDVKVVAISEGYHNCGDMMSLHHRIIRYLVKYHGFTTVITETGLPESRIIHDYIVSSGEANETTEMNDDTKNLLYQQGLNKMYAEWEEGRNLIEWMKQYNNQQQQQQQQQIQYYGSDIGGFYQDWKTPFQQRIFDYLKKVDPEFHDKLSASLQPYLENLMKQNARLNYQDQLSLQEKANLAVILDEAVLTMDTKRKQYLEQSDDKEFEWARQSLESMRLAEHYYRNYEHQNRDQCQQQQQQHLCTSKFVGLNVREIAMHRNTLWALEQERKRLAPSGKDVKAILISHVIHTKTETQYQNELWGFFTPLGAMLKQSLDGPKKKFVSIGMVYGGGQYWQNWQKGRGIRQIAPVPPPFVASKTDEENDDDDEQRGSSSIESTLKKIGQTRCFLPWKDAPSSSWLSSPAVMRENDYFINIRPKEWDACIYLKEVHPATPVDVTETMV